MSTLQTYNLKHPDASGNQITFTSGGLVGVGTSAPGTGTSSYYDDLVVKNDTAGTGAGITIQSNSTNGFSGLDLRTAGGTEIAKIAASAATSKLSIDAGGSTAITIDSSQRVGIGESSPAAKLDVNGNQTSNVVAIAALDVNCSAGNYFTKTINGNSTFTFSNVPSSRSFSFVLELTHTSGTVTWPSSVKFPGDTAPTLTAGKTHLFVFETNDGGTRFRGATLVDYVN